jgi:AcrR family transcriptional regulator
LTTERVPADVGPALPPTARGLRTRQNLIRGARLAFEDKGYLDANVRDIASAAQVAYGTFYTYFSSKEEIFEEVVQDLVEDLRAVANAEPHAHDPIESIERANRGYLRAYRANARMMAILEQVATFSPRLGEVRRAARRHWVERSEAAISRWQEAGLVDLRLDPYYAASALGSMVDRSAYVWLVLGEPFEEDAAVEQLTRLYCNALGMSGSDAVHPRGEQVLWEPDPH